MNYSIKAGLAEPLPPHRWLTDEDGRRLAFSEYPAPAPWLRLVISHGFGEHRGWYHHVATALQAEGVSVYTFDHFHHGLSDGRPGDVANFRLLSNGLRMALGEAAEDGAAGEAPLALLGHSNGGLATLRLLPELAAGSLAAVVLSNPLIGMRGRLGHWGMWVARLLSLFRPGMMLPAVSIPERLSGNEEVWPDYERDRLRLRVLSVRFFREMVSNAAQARQAASCHSFPLLLLFGERDQVVDREATRQWFERVEAPTKKMIAYPGLEHELFNEKKWPAILAEVVTWLKIQVGGEQAKSTSQKIAQV